MIIIQIKPIKQEVYVCYCQLCSFKTYADSYAEAEDVMMEHYDRTHKVGIEYLVRTSIIKDTKEP